jgi:hypothetical protein
MGLIKQAKLISIQKWVKILDLLPPCKPRKMQAKVKAKVKV